MGVGGSFGRGRGQTAIEAAVKRKLPYYLYVIKIAGIFVSIYEYILLFEENVHYYFKARSTYNHAVSVSLLKIPRVVR